MKRAKNQSLFVKKEIDWSIYTEIKVRFNKKGERYKIPTKLVVKKSELKNYENRL